MHCNSYRQYLWIFFTHQDACAAILEELKLEVQRGENSLTELTAAGNPHGESSSSSVGGFILVIDGRTLDWALQEELKSDFLELSCRCKAVICCRSTPLQKSQVVRLIRDQLGVMTLAVGKDSDRSKTAGKFYICPLSTSRYFKCIFLSFIFVIM